MRVMKDMELDDEDKLDRAFPCDPCVTATKKLVPEYPWGLRISFDESTISKLGLDFAQMQVGGLIHGHFMARITSTSEDQGSDGVRRRVELQIQQMCVEGEDEENEKTKPKRASPKVLYKTG